MAPVGRHAGEHGSTGAPSAGARSRLFLLAAGLTLTIVAWGFLVWVAVDFGAEARSGNAMGWVFLGIATIGATGALFLGLIVGNKTLLALRGQGADPRPPRAPKGVAGKRAAR